MKRSENFSLLNVSSRDFHLLYPKNVITDKFNLYIIKDMLYKPQNLFSTFFPHSRVYTK